MKSPFKFLDAYTREDREIFFGRDREIEEIYLKVFESKILLVYGISGTGKTSLIDCGLANKLEESDWLPVTVRRGSNIVDSLTKELEKAAIYPISIDTNKIVKAIQSIYLDHFKPIYLILDQFEELFIFGDREERREFIEIIKAIIDSDVQCRFIFSIREEYLASITEFELTINDFLSNRMRIEKMTSQHAIEVIEGPCKVHGIEVEDGFSEKLLDKLNPQGKDVELTFLQVFLDKIFKLANEKSKGSKTRNQEPGTRNEEQEAGDMGHGLVFSNNLLEEVGDVSDLLGSFLEEQVSQLDDPETGLVVLKGFVSVKGTKRQITEDEVVEFSKTLGKQIEPDKLKELIQRYVNLRILRDKDENNRYELRHDSLAAKIFEKITLVEKELLEVRQFIENAYQSYEKRKLLLNEKDLRYLKVYEDRLFLEGELKAFVDQCKKVIEAKHRAFKRILRISIAGFILFLASIGIYYFQSTSEAKQMEKVAKSLMQSGVAPELSFQSAVELYNMDTTSSIAHYALLNSFYELLDKGASYDSITDTFNNPYKMIFEFRPCKANIVSARFSDDGELIYGWLADNMVRVWDKKGSEILSLKEEKGAIVAVSLSGDGKHIAVIYVDSTGVLWDLKNERIFEFPVLINPVFNEKVIDFSPDGKLLAVAGINHDVVLYDLNGTMVQHLAGHAGNINYISFSHENRFIASASDDKSVIIWNYNKYSSTYGQYGEINGHIGKVRSCNFSASNKYLLTASDDSSLCIWNLNGDKRYEFNFNWEFDLFRGKICNAEFLGNDRVIRVTGYYSTYSKAIESSEKGIMGEFIYEQVLITGDDFYIQEGVSEISKLISRFDWWSDIANYRKLQFTDYSHLSNSLAEVPAGEKYTLLRSADLLPLKTFPGGKPSYSPDGNYLLCVHVNELKVYPVSVHEIFRLVEKEKIFGELKYSVSNWDPGL